jgi:hypothetical protein
VLDGLSYVRGATLSSLRDTSNDRYDFISNFGVLHLDFSPKPGYAALQAALRSRPPAAVSCKTLLRSRKARRNASKAALKRCIRKRAKARVRRRR